MSDVSAQNGPCIYPGPHGAMSSEHFLSEGLGRFSGCEPLEGKVCRPCNIKIGNETETQFLRTGPISYFRWMIGVDGKNGAPPHPFYRGAGGAPPILAAARVAEYPFPILWETRRGTQECFPLRQIIFDHKLLDSYPVPIFDSMLDNPDRVRSYLKDNGLEGGKPIFAFAAPDEATKMKNLVTALGGALRGEWFMTEVEPRTVQIVMKVSVTEAFFRAIAKIAFHYTLKVFPDLSGSESEFAEIKNFVWNGGGFERFVVHHSNPVFGPYYYGYRPNGWCHILAVRRSRGQVVAFAQFFAGPHAMPPTYEIRLGSEPRRLWTPPETKAHIFLYPDPEHGIGPEGLMDDLLPANLVTVLQ